MSNIHRYPGVQPFKKEEQSIFFGRDQDIQDLFDMVILEKLVLLFGKSGYGKSSLINAGLIPKLEEEEAMISLIVRMRSYTTDQRTPVQKILDALSEKVSLEEDITSLEHLWRNQPASLWYEFKRRTLNEATQYFLIFDQFEEFFTYPIAQQIAFREQLAELLFTEIPRFIRDQWKTLDKSQKRSLSEPLEVKVLFAIREDKLSLVNSLRLELPAILHKRYELQGLSRLQAEEAIIKPAQIPQGGTYISPAFEYEEESLRIILSELSHTQHKLGLGEVREMRIESFLLQIYCEFLEQFVIGKKAATEVIRIKPSDLPDFDNIYEQYYQRKIEELSESQREGAKKVLEEGLLYYNEESGEARRLSVDGDQLLAEFKNDGINEQTLVQLKNQFLIREEPNTTGGSSFEISHDVLIWPILEARKLRQEAERKAQERKKFRRVLLLGSVALMITLGAVSLTLWAMKQKGLADERSRKLTKQTAIAENLKEEALLKADSLRDILTALQTQIYKTDLLAFEKLNRSIEIYMRANDRLLIEEALIEMKSIAEKYKDSLYMQRIVAQIGKKLN